jgi:CBS domain-containing protein
MKIREVMTREAKLANPDDTLQHAAKLMKECDCAILPVAEGDRLIGIITDRDIAVRAVAEGKGPNAKVREAMTKEVKYSFEEEDGGGDPSVAKARHSGRALSLRREGDSRSPERAPLPIHAFVEQEKAPADDSRRRDRRQTFQEAQTTQILR